METPHRLHPRRVWRMENEESEEDTRPQGLYTIFAAILVFFVMGLLGILLCRLLQERGYRCRTSRQLNTEREAGLVDEDVHDTNQDTLGQIVQCILNNTANAEALQEMLKQHEEMKLPEHSPLFPEPLTTLSAAPTSHHHTVHGGGTGVPRAVCLHCSRQGRSAIGQARSHPLRGEVTVFSVGRFRVTHIERFRTGKEPNPPPREESHVGSVKDTATDRGDGSVESAITDTAASEPKPVEPLAPLPPGCPLLTVMTGGSEAHDR
ncbi:RELT-like protein 2 isoform X2 [Amblyraja radiata]|uniref:RELT-like protein 2 isoform X2 n=1 Tax=Amblyraja radiata TaxID=386614 RepID=UPI00140265F7|nr:RELT-like protein 2 isoform X2 [Amblyraja radiata]